MSTNDFAQHTLVISRRVDIERRARFKSEALRIGLRNWSFFEAIDGPGMRLATSTPSLFGRHNRPAPNPLSPGEIGCVLSHVAICRVAYALDLAHVCVIEDDVEFIESTVFWAGWADFLASLPPDWLMLHAAGDAVAPETEPVVLNEHVARVRQSYGTRFMVLTREALTVLINQPVTMCEPSDWMLRPLFDTGRVYCPRQQLVRDRNDPGGMP